MLNSLQISKYAEVRKINEIIQKICLTSNSNVLIFGESGTGKELIAQMIHYHGLRKNGPFVPINCGAIPPGLLESELFGYEKGAFTGAYAQKKGKFEYANKGTLFLDEVTTMPLYLQAKLLRVLQERSFERIGSNQIIKFDSQIIAATNVNIRDAVEKCAFREDLYYRLNVIPIELPPLRARKEDISTLIDYFLEKFNKAFNKKVYITDEALEILKNYFWPGNIRELQNLIEMMVVLADDQKNVSKEDLPIYLITPPTQYEINGLKLVIRKFEKKLIEERLRNENWNIVKTAKILNVHRNTLLKKMKDLDIKVKKC